MDSELKVAKYWMNMHPKCKFGGKLFPAYLRHFHEPS